MAREFVLDLEKYLDHQVNDLCVPYGAPGAKVVHDLYGPNKFNESIGIPLVEIHHRKQPQPMSGPTYVKDYFMLDFEDFLEYATSNLVPPPTIDLVPHYHCYYYQAFSDTYNKPLVANK